MMSTRAKEPGRRNPRSFGTSASTIKRAVLLLHDRRQANDAAAIDGGIAFDRQASPRARRARQRPRARGPARAAAAGARAPSSRSACPPARYSPTDACLRLTTPSSGDRITVSVSCCRARSSSERRCAITRLAVADLLERVLVAPSATCRLASDGVELGAGDQLLLHELDAAVAREPRVVQHRAGLADDRRLLGIDALVAARGRKPEADARLLQRRPPPARRGT